MNKVHPQEENNWRNIKLPSVKVFRTNHIQNSLKYTCSRKTCSWGWDPGLTETSNRGIKILSRIFWNEWVIPISLYTLYNRGTWSKHTESLSLSLSFSLWHAHTHTLSDCIFYPINQCSTLLYRNLCDCILYPVNQYSTLLTHSSFISIYQSVQFLARLS